MSERCCRVPVRIPKDLTGHADLLKTIADPHRLRILATLARADDDVCVCDLNDDISVSQPTVSHHLRLLKDAGLVSSERRGTWVYYRLADDVRARLTDVLDAILPQRTLA
jgi:DNA-binding transcriptional ArsR family regulator